MHKVFEIFFDDLIISKQKEILKFYNIKSSEEANLDVIPIAILEIEGDDIHDHN